MFHRKIVRCFWGPYGQERRRKGQTTMPEYKSYYSAHSRRSQSQSIGTAGNKLNDIAITVYIGVFGFVIAFVIYKYYFEEAEPKKPRKRRGWKYIVENEQELADRAEWMSSLLIANNWTEPDVENLLLWSLVNRDSEGWIDIENPGLNLTGENFLSMDSLLLDLSAGEFEIFMTESHEGHCGYFSMDDVMEILSLGITESEFSLDQVDPTVKYHPFQLVNFGPSELKNTSYLRSLLHADYLLKMMSQGTEVCAKHPFSFRDGYEGFLQLLPDRLQKKICPNDRDRNCAYRFWIESQELPYTAQLMDNRKIEFAFGHCPMIVKCHRLTYNENGKLVDDSENPGDSDTDAARFAREFTKYYDEIGAYFPIFLRLRQLSTISAVSKILNSIVMQGFNSEFLNDLGIGTSLSFAPVARTLQARGIYVGHPHNLNYHDHGRECAWVVSAVTGLSRIRSTETMEATEKAIMYGGVRLGSKMVRMRSLPKRSSTSQYRVASSGSGSGGGGSGGSDGEDFKKPQKMNKNKKKYAGETHVYMLYPKFGLPRDGKLGISSRGIRKSDGKSIRAEQQTRRLFRETGVEHESHVYKVFKNREEALNFESKIISMRRRLTNDPEFYKLEKKQHRFKPDYKNLPTIDSID